MFQGTQVVETGRKFDTIEVTKNGTLKNRGRNCALWKIKATDFSSFEKLEKKTRPEFPTGHGKVIKMLKRAKIKRPRGEEVLELLDFDPFEVGFRALGQKFLHERVHGNSARCKLLPDKLKNDDEGKRLHKSAQLTAKIW